MAARSPGISGLAVALATAGGLLLYTGLRDIPIIDGLREITQGKTPTPRPSSGAPKFVIDDSSVGGQAPGSGGGGKAPVPIGTGAHPEIAQAAAKYLGVPYVWARADPSGMDCSGLVTWVLHHDLGYQLPSNTHTVTQQFMIWSGATTIPRDQCAAGDLVCWSGHIGIAIDNARMINAPKPGTVVRVDDIWRVPAPLIRRVNARKATVSV